MSKRVEEFTGYFRPHCHCYRKELDFGIRANGLRSWLTGLAPVGEGAEPRERQRVCVSSGPTRAGHTGNGGWALTGRSLKSNRCRCFDEKGGGRGAIMSIRTKKRARARVVVVVVVE